MHKPRPIRQGRLVLRQYIVRARLLGMKSVADRFATMTRREWKEKLPLLVKLVEQETQRKKDQ